MLDDYVVAFNKAVYGQEHHVTSMNVRAWSNVTAFDVNSQPHVKSNGQAC